MANFWTNKAITDLVKGDLDFDTADLRAILVMTNTTADTEKDKTTVGAYTTLDEFDGSGYTAAAGGVTLDGEAVVLDAGGSNRAGVDATDEAFGNLGLGTRQVAGILVIRFVTNQSSSIPLFWIDTTSGGTTSFPFWTNGGSVTVTWNAAGIAYIQA